MIIFFSYAKYKPQYYPMVVVLKNEIMQLNQHQKHNQQIHLILKILKKKLNN